MSKKEQLIEKGFPMSRTIQKKNKKKMDQNNKNKQMKIFILC